MAKRIKAAKRSPRLTARAARHLSRRTDRAVVDQRATGATYDHRTGRLFALSAALIAASAILGHLELGSSNVGLLSWITIAVTATAWLAGWIGQRFRLAEDVVAPVTTVSAELHQRRQFAERELVEANSARYANESILRQRRRWLTAFAQLVALQTALIVAVELAAR